MSSQHLETDFYQADYWEMSRLCEWPLYLFCVEETIRHIPTWFRAENSGFMMLILLLEGQVTYNCGGLRYELRPGKMLLLPLGSDYSFDSGEGGGYHKIVVELKGLHLASIADTMGLGKALLLDVPDHMALAARCRETGRLLRAREQEGTAAIMEFTYGLLARAALLASGGTERSRLLSLAQMRLETRLDEPMNIPQLAKDLGISCATLNRLFRENLRTSPQKYRMACRMEQARSLLESSSLSIKEIASRIGYCNQFYFANEFKRLTRLTPKSCRGIHRYRRA